MTPEEMRRVSRRMRILERCSVSSDVLYDLWAAIGEGWSAVGYDCIPQEFLEEISEIRIHITELKNRLLQEGMTL